MSDSKILVKVADILEKTASYLEETESRKITEEKTARTKAATELADKLSEVTGEELETSVIDKLAQLDPEISKYLGKIAGESTPVESMGGPRETSNEKTASSGGPSAESRFVDWITGP